MADDIDTPAEVHPERLKLTELVRFSEKRLRRATERQSAAVSEFGDARTALQRAPANLADWIDANPDPQLPLPLAAASKPTGEHQ